MLLLLAPHPPLMISVHLLRDRRPFCFITSSASLQKTSIQSVLCDTAHRANPSPPDKYNIFQNFMSSCLVQVRQTPSYRVSGSTFKAQWWLARLFQSVTARQPSCANQCDRREVYCIECFH